jgi:hypothetical protein
VGGGDVGDVYRDRLDEPRVGARRYRRVRLVEGDRQPGVTGGEVAVGWDAVTLVTIVCRLARTLSIVGPMLPVVSTVKTMSGFGGIAGVWTVLATSNEDPGLAVLSTVDGSTPGVAAYAGAPNADAGPCAPSREPRSQTRIT